MRLASSCGTGHVAALHHCEPSEVREFCDGGHERGCGEELHEYCDRVRSDERACFDCASPLRLPPPSQRPGQRPA